MATVKNNEFKTVTYPFPETRFLHAGSNVYKFKIRYGNSIRGEEIEDKGVLIQELEDSIRAVLANMDSLQPFVTEHFIVFPWKPADDIPLELVLAEKEAEEATMRKRKLREEPSSPRRPEPYRAKMETSSEASSSKEPLKENKRARKKPEEPHEKFFDEFLSMKSQVKFSIAVSRDEEGQQEYQASPACNAIAVKERDATLRHSLPGLVVPPLQHSNPSPLKEPGARGFLGFLSRTSETF
ncbi:Membrane-anchored junction protein [Apodemus speciosus]|uniref:Membrane-anchored junction protein n=1 Tax=Apodemus speciosus TaxID=105296 RepID=A0ABQ0FS86_APOSI